MAQFLYRLYNCHFQWSLPRFLSSISMVFCYQGMFRYLFKSISFITYIGNDNWYEFSLLSFQEYGFQFLVVRTVLSFIIWGITLDFGWTLLLFMLLQNGLFYFFYLYVVL